MEGDASIPDSPAVQVADESVFADHLAGAVPDGLLGLTAGRQQGARSVDGEAVPAWIESMLEAELSEGYSASAAPRRLEIRDVRLGVDALTVIRPDRPPYEPGQNSQVAWSLAGGTSALQPMEPCLPPIITGTGSGAEGRTQHSERPCPPDGPIDPPPPDDPPDPGNPPIICPETVGAHGDCPPDRGSAGAPATTASAASGGSIVYPGWVLRDVVGVAGHGGLRLLHLNIEAR